MYHISYIIYLYTILYILYISLYIMIFYGILNFVLYYLYRWRRWTQRARGEISGLDSWSQWFAQRGPQWNCNLSRFCFRGFEATAARVDQPSVWLRSLELYTSSSSRSVDSTCTMTYTTQQNACASQDLRDCRTRDEWRKQREIHIENMLIYSVHGNILAYRLYSDCITIILIII